MAGLNEEQIAEISSAILGGDKIGAIKLHREHTGADLRGAKEAVEAMERQLKEDGVVRAGSFDATAEFSEEDARAMTEAILAGRKIDAIKRYRESSGKGLKDSKAVIDDLERQLREECPERFTAPPSRLGCGVVMLLGGMLGMAGWLVG